MYRVLRQLRRGQREVDQSFPVFDEGEPDDKRAEFRRLQAFADHDKVLTGLTWTTARG